MVVRLGLTLDDNGIPVLNRALDENGNTLFEVGPGGNLVSPDGASMFDAESARVLPIKATSSSLPVVGANISKVDPRLVEVVTAGAGHLPPGYKVSITEGYAAGGHTPKSQHKRAGRGALDIQISGPNGPIPRKGADTTGMYTQLARYSYGEMLNRYPELKGQFAWGAAFGTRGKKGGTSDLMHFDLGGERGSLKPGMRLSNLGPLYGTTGETAVARAEPAAPAATQVAMTRPLKKPVEQPPARPLRRPTQTAPGLQETPGLPERRPQLGASLGSFEAGPPLPTRRPERPGIATNTPDIETPGLPERRPAISQPTETFGASQTHPPGGLTRPTEVTTFGASQTHPPGGFMRPTNISTIRPGAGTSFVTPSIMGAPAAAAPAARMAAPAARTAAPAKVATSTGAKAAGGKGILGGLLGGGKGGGGVPQSTWGGWKNVDTSTKNVESLKPKITAIGQTLGTNVQGLSLLDMLHQELSV